MTRFRTLSPLAILFAASALSAPAAAAPATGPSRYLTGGDLFNLEWANDPEISPDGAPAETRCMSACVGKIRLQGLVQLGDDGKWAKDPENPLYFLIRERQIALPLYPQFGTEPNGFYIPPRWVPRPYLVQMFGPGVDHALEQYSCPDRELLAVLQLFRASQQIIFRFEIKPGPKVAEVQVTMPSGKSKVQEIYNDTVIGYNKRGEEAGCHTNRQRHTEPLDGAPAHKDEDDGGNQGQPGSGGRRKPRQCWAS